MIHGIGTDIVELQRIEKAIEKFGDRFAKKILSAAEYNHFKLSMNQVQFLAGRFAAKEAFSKAIGTGMSEGLFFNDIIVSNEQSGKPVIELTGEAKELLISHKIKSVHISISHEKKYATAFVICERGNII